MPSDSSIIVVSSIIFIFSVVVEWVGTQYSQLHEGAGTLLRFYIITVVIVAETPNKAPRASCPHPITSCDPYRSSEGAGADFRWCRPAIRSVVAVAFRHGYWGGKWWVRVKVMANDFISPVGLPEKGVRIWILGQSDFALGQTSLVILLAVLRSHRSPHHQPVSCASISPSMILFPRENNNCHYPRHTYSG